MWPTNTKSHQKPTAPKFDEILSQGVYGCEQGCDVVFLVGPEDETWRIPAHRTILQNATPVFRAMFSEYFIPHGVVLSEEHPHTVKVSDVDGKAFDNLLRHLYAEEMRFQSVESVLRTLYAAHKYQCPELVQKCVDYLNQNLNVNNILPILSNVPLLCGNVQNLENWGRERQMLIQEMILSSSAGGTDVQMMVVDGEDNLLNFSKIAAAASASQNQNSESSDNFLDSIENSCSKLLQNCLSFVDKEATAVLQLDEMEDLDVDTFRLILSRDTLNVYNENLIFSVILKWADKECKRQQLPLTVESKRQVLGDSLYLPRYLTMTLSSFLGDHGPAKSGLFTPTEVDCLTRILNDGKLSDGSKSDILIQTLLSPDLPSPQNNPLGIIPASLRPYYRILARPRCPIRSLGGGDGASPAKKSRGIIERWNTRRCCRSRRNNNNNNCRSSRSNNSSQLSSPSNSNPSSPRRNLSSVHQPKKWNLCVERVVIFLACLFD